MEYSSIIGGADGPTAIFLAGRLGTGFKTGIIIFVTAVLILAAFLALWKPGVRTKYRFIRLSVANLLIHLMDGLITFVNTPNLSMEGNILVRRFGLGWGALFTANLISFLLIVLAAWYFNKYEHVPICADGVFDYYMKLFYGENYKTSWFWYKFSRNYRSKMAMAGYAFYWGLTAGAPVFVIGWLLHMLDLAPRWWHSQWAAAMIGIGVAIISMYIWAREGYRCGLEKENRADAGKDREGVNRS